MKLTLDLLEVRGLSEQADGLHEHILHKHTDVTAAEALCVDAQLREILLCRMQHKE